ncbi:hypothetical protein GCM10007862_27640 [Dyella lipolytica]|uniref:Uncharacterized protein n=1 Tax=Dyella lipolytica TaxID=1867835 RepID=A0ABW8IV17_9GAMM|nr:hypothetical protein [Dyella lipolytica]GLQ47713.1 hypothetical protein GCM10007862_27640 [Dyella lipolytica]
MDAHVPQRQGVVRLSLATQLHRWPGWLLAIGWALLLACMPWWIDLPLLLALAAAQVARVPRLHSYNGIIRRALRWGLAGLLVASYRALGGHALGLTLTLLAALIGFSLLVLLESWQDHKPQHSAATAAASPEWSDLALAPIGPSAAIIELKPPTWIMLEGPATRAPVDVALVAERRCRVGASTLVNDVEPQISITAGQGWIAFPITAGRGVVLYDRAHDRQYRLRGWQLYGWHDEEAWLTRGEDQAPLALSHVLGQDQVEE